MGRSSDRHTQDFLIGRNHLVADCDDGLQGQFGIGDRRDDIGNLGTAVDGLQGHRFGILTGLERAFRSPFHKISEIGTGRLARRLKARADFSGIYISADGTGNW